MRDVIQKIAFQSNVASNQGRSQEFSMGGSGGSLGALIRRKQGDLGGEASSAGQFLQFFNKNNTFFCIFRPK